MLSYSAVRLPGSAAALVPIPQHATAYGALGREGGIGSVHEGASLPESGGRRDEQGGVHPMRQAGTAGVRRRADAGVRGCDSATVFGPHRPGFGGAVASQSGSADADAAGPRQMVELDHTQVPASGAVADPSGDGGVRLEPRNRGGSDGGPLVAYPDASCHWS